CHKVNLDDLWKFFFETGFVYPHKYASIHENKKKFKKTYNKLYMQNPHIARHFIHQDKGIIGAHFSMIRFYENTWLIHHHAAIRSNDNIAGLVVLDQVVNYINDFHHLYSTHMNFIISYFRPDNKFPSRVFGKSARELKNPKACSIDSFAYFHFSRNDQNFNPAEKNNLVKTRPEDLIELKNFYEHDSGGLMLDALDLTPELINSSVINKEYSKLRLKRERHLFSLKKDGHLKAIFIVNISDFGLNMSNLTNCIHVIFLSENLPRNILYTSLSGLSKYYKQDQIPVLLYPMNYAETQEIPYERTYNLWILNMQYTDQYFKYANVIGLLNSPQDRGVIP
ncbi:MAG: PilZ domain-containing protein, partial [bacterium]|nr:PilZ domain-containing protein [bacterium]